MSLTPQAISAILGGQKVQDPIVQVLAIKKITKQKKEGEEAKPDRYKLTISDGKQKHGSAMLATQLNNLVEDDKIRPNGTLKLVKYLCQDVSERRIIIILHCEVISQDVGGVIGDVEEEGGAAAAAAPAASVATAAPAAAGASSAVKTSPSNPYHAQKYSSAASHLDVGSPKYIPINALQPYLNTWTIRGRVGNKSPLRTWTNQKGSGKLFSVDLIDQSGEIRATGFNEVCDQLYDRLQVGKVYIFRGGKIKVANQKFNQLSNRYELSFSEATDVREDVDAGDIPQQNFAFKTFTELAGLEVSRDMNVFVDVIAVVVDVPEVTSIVTRTAQKELSKRDIQLKDRDSVTLQCTLWGEEAEQFVHNGGAVGAVLAIKSGRLSDFNNRSLSVSSNSTMLINPDIKEAHELKGWFDSEGQSTNSKSLTVKSAGGGGGAPTIHIGQIKDQKIGQSEGKGEYFTIKGSVSYVRKENCLYMACPSASCNKKVVEDGAGQYRCEKCQQTYPNFDWRLMMSVSMCDATGQVWVTAFQETAEQLLRGVTANELGNMKETNPDQFDAVVQNMLFQTWSVRCRAKLDTWNDQMRVRTSAMSASPLNYAEECRTLIDSIKEYL